MHNNAIKVYMIRTKSFRLEGRERFVKMGELSKNGLDYGTK